MADQNDSDDSPEEMETDSECSDPGVDGGDWRIHKIQGHWPFEASRQDSVFYYVTWKLGRGQVEDWSDTENWVPDEAMKCPETIASYWTDVEHQRKKKRKLIKHVPPHAVQKEARKLFKSRRPKEATPTQSPVRQPEQKKRRIVDSSSSSEDEIVLKKTEKRPTAQDERPDRAHRKKSDELLTRERRKDRALSKIRTERHRMDSSSSSAVASRTKTLFGSSSSSEDEEIVLKKTGNERRATAQDERPERAHRKKSDELLTHERRKERALSKIRAIRTSGTEQERPRMSSSSALSSRTDSSSQSPSKSTSPDDFPTSHFGPLKHEPAVVRKPEDPRIRSIGPRRRVDEDSMTQSVPIHKLLQQKEQRTMLPAGHWQSRNKLMEAGPKDTDRPTCSKSQDAMETPTKKSAPRERMPAVSPPRPPKNGQLIMGAVAEEPMDMDNNYAFQSPMDDPPQHEESEDGCKVPKEEIDSDEEEDGPRKKRIRPIVIESDEDEDSDEERDVKPQIHGSEDIKPIIEKLQLSDFKPNITDNSPKTKSSTVRGLDSDSAEEPEEDLGDTSTYGNLVIAEEEEESDDDDIQFVAEVRNKPSTSSDQPKPKSSSSRPSKAIERIPPEQENYLEKIMARFFRECWSHKYNALARNLTPVFIIMFAEYKKKDFAMTVFENEEGQKPSYICEMVYTEVIVARNLQLVQDARERLRVE